MPQAYVNTVSTVQSGVNISNAIDIRGLKTLGIHAPALASSCAMFFQVAPGLTTPASASFVRLAQHAVASGQLLPWYWPIAGGSAAAIVSLVDNPFPYGRIELTVSQQALVSFTLCGRY